MNGEDIDLLVVTDKSAYVVEVKTKPKKKDVTLPAKKVKVVGTTLGKPLAVPVLAGALIGDNVEEYAIKKKVLVYHI